MPDKTTNLMTFIAIAAILTGTLLLSSPQNIFAATEKITNGGFEEPDVSPVPDGWNIFSTVNGWNIAWNDPTADGDVGADPDSCVNGETGNNTNGMLEIHDNVLGFGGANSSIQYAELDGDCQGPSSNNGDDNSRVQTTISQDIQTCKDGTYDLSFYYRDRDVSSELEVKWGADGITPVLTWDNGSWKLATVTGLTGDGSTKTLAFKDVGFADASGTLVDEVSLIETCPQITVAGELVPLNTTALFISSLSSSMIWMAPTILGIVGVGVYIKSKKN